MKSLRRTTFGEIENNITFWLNESDAMVDGVYKPSVERTFVKLKPVVSGNEVFNAMGINTFDFHENDVEVFVLEN